MKLQYWFVYQLVFGYREDFDLLSIVCDIVCTMDILFYLFVIFTIISYFAINIMSSEKFEFTVCITQGCL